MKATEFVSEIERLPQAGYVGGKSTLKQDPEYVKKTALPTAKPLPGGSGLLYGIEVRNYQTIVRIYDPETNQPIGALKLDKKKKSSGQFSQLTKLTPLPLMRIIRARALPNPYMASC